MEIRMQSPVGARTVFSGREMDYFAGTGYLGLQGHPAVAQAAIDALRQYGLATATSRGGYGEHPVYDEMEREAAAFFGAEKVLYFSSGYMGMGVLTQATTEQYEHIFIDASAHYSLWDAAQTSNKPVTPFHHRDADSLAEKLKRELQPGERPLILSDGIFPISGEIAPLPGYLELAKTYNGQVYLDDAHAVGTIGKNGRGTPDYFGIEDEACRTSGTLAKALGGFGGILWGKTGWVDQIDQNSRICVGASPPPIPVAAASAKALEIVRTTPELRQTLTANVARARNGLRAAGWDLEDTPSPIVCLAARPNDNLERMKSRMFEQGIAIAHVRSYSSTPAGGALRIAIFATHSTEQIDRLVEAMGKL
jgi:glycine C-acetyltransferase/8-amino-7-oxononanoate synthase